MIEHVRLKPSRCPNCGKSNDSATALDGDNRPKPGDIGICFYCHHIMCYAADMTLRNLTDAEMIEVAGEPEILVAMRALGEAEK